MVKNNSDYFVCHLCWMHTPGYQPLYLGPKGPYGVDAVTDNVDIDFDPSSDMRDDIKELFDECI